MSNSIDLNLFELFLDNTNSFSILLWWNNLNFSNLPSQLTQNFTPNYQNNLFNSLPKTHPLFKFILLVKNTIQNHINKCIILDSVSKLNVIEFHAACRGIRWGIQCHHQQDAVPQLQPTQQQQSLHSDDNSHPITTTNQSFSTSNPNLSERVQPGGIFGSKTVTKLPIQECISVMGEQQSELLLTKCGSYLIDHEFHIRVHNYQQIISAMPYSNEEHMLSGLGLRNNNNNNNNHRNIQNTLNTNHDDENFIQNLKNDQEFLSQIKNDFNHKPNNPIVIDPYLQHNGFIQYNQHLPQNNQIGDQNGQNNHYSDSNNYHFHSFINQNTLYSIPDPHHTSLSPRTNTSTRPSTLPDQPPQYNTDLLSPKKTLFSPQNSFLAQKKSTFLPQIPTRFIPTISLSNQTLTVNDTQYVIIKTNRIINRYHHHYASYLHHKNSQHSPHHHFGLHNNNYNNNNYYYSNKNRHFSNNLDNDFEHSQTVNNALITSNLPPNTEQCIIIPNLPTKDRFSYQIPLLTVYYLRILMSRLNLSIRFIIIKHLTFLAQHCLFRYYVDFLFFSRKVQRNIITYQYNHPSEVELDPITLTEHYNQSNRSNYSTYDVNDFFQNSQLSTNHSQNHSQDHSQDHSQNNSEPIQNNNSLNNSPENCQSHLLSTSTSTYPSTTNSFNTVIPDLTPAPPNDPPIFPHPDNNNHHNQNNSENHPDKNDLHLPALTTFPSTATSDSEYTPRHCVIDHDDPNPIHFYASPTRSEREHLKVLSSEIRFLDDDYFSSPRVTNPNSTTNTNPNSTRGDLDSFLVSNDKNHNNSQSQEQPLLFLTNSSPEDFPNTSSQHNSNTMTIPELTTSSTLNETKIDDKLEQNQSNEGKNEDKPAKKVGFFRSLFSRKTTSSTFSTTTTTTTTSTTSTAQQSNHIDPQVNNNLNDGLNTLTLNHQPKENQQGSQDQQDQPNSSNSTTKPDPFLIPPLQTHQKMILPNGTTIMGYFLNHYELISTPSPGGDHNNNLAEKSPHKNENFQTVTPPASISPNYNNSTDIRSIASTTLSRETSRTSLASPHQSGSNFGIYGSIGSTQSSNPKTDSNIENSERNIFMNTNLSNKNSNSQLFQNNFNNIPDEYYAIDDDNEYIEHYQQIGGIISDWVLNLPLTTQNLETYLWQKVQPKNTALSKNTPQNKYTPTGILSPTPFGMNNNSGNNFNSKGYNINGGEFEFPTLETEFNLEKFTTFLTQIEYNFSNENDNIPFRINNSANNNITSNVSTTLPKNNTSQNFPQTTPKDLQTPKSTSTTTLFSSTSDIIAPNPNSDNRFEMFQNLSQTQSQNSSNPPIDISSQLYPLELIPHITPLDLPTPYLTVLNTILSTTTSLHTNLQSQTILKIKNLKNIFSNFVAETHFEKIFNTHYSPKSPLLDRTDILFLNEKPPAAKYLAQNDADIINTLLCSFESKFFPSTYNSPNHLPNPVKRAQFYPLTSSTNQNMNLANSDSSGLIGSYGSAGKNRRQSDFSKPRSSSNDQSDFNIGSASMNTTSNNVIPIGSLTEQQPGSLLGNVEHVNLSASVERSSSFLGFSMKNTSKNDPPKEQIQKTPQEIEDIIMNSVVYDLIVEQTLVYTNNTGNIINTTPDGETKNESRANLYNDKKLNQNEQQNTNNNTTPATPIQISSSSYSNNQHTSSNLGSNRRNIDYDERNGIKNKQINSIDFPQNGLKKTDIAPNLSQHLLSYFINNYLATSSSYQDTTSTGTIGEYQSGGELPNHVPLIYDANRCTSSKSLLQQSLQHFLHCTISVPFSNIFTQLFHIVNQKLFSALLRPIFEMNLFYNKEIYFFLLQHNEYQNFLYTWKHLLTPPVFEFSPLYLLLKLPKMIFELQKLICGENNDKNNQKNPKIGQINHNLLLPLQLSLYSAIFHDAYPILHYIASGGNISIGKQIFIQMLQTQQNAQKNSEKVDPKNDSNIPSNLSNSNPSSRVPNSQLNSSNNTTSDGIPNAVIQEFEKVLKNQKDDAVWRHKRIWLKSLNLTQFGTESLAVPFNVLNDYIFLEDLHKRDWDSLQAKIKLRAEKAAQRLLLREKNEKIRLERERNGGKNANGDKIGEKVVIGSAEISSSQLPSSLLTNNNNNNNNNNSQIVHSLQFNSLNVDANTPSSYRIDTPTPSMPQNNTDNIHNLISQNTAPPHTNNNNTSNPNPTPSSNPTPLTPPTPSPHPLPHRSLYPDYKKHYTVSKADLNAKVQFYMSELYQLFHLDLSPYSTSISVLETLTLPSRSYSKLRRRKEGQTVSSVIEEDENLYSSAFGPKYQECVTKHIEKNNFGQLSKPQSLCDVNTNNTNNTTLGVSHVGVDVVYSSHNLASTISQLYTKNVVNMGITALLKKEQLLNTASETADKIQHDGTRTKPPENFTQRLLPVRDANNDSISALIDVNDNNLSASHGNRMAMLDRLNTGNNTKMSLFLFHYFHSRFLLTQQSSFNPYNPLSSTFQPLTLPKTVPFSFFTSTNDNLSTCSQKFNPNNNLFRNFPHLFPSLLSQNPLNIHSPNPQNNNCTPDLTRSFHTFSNHNYNISSTPAASSSLHEKELLDPLNYFQNEQYETEIELNNCTIFSTNPWDILTIFLATIKSSHIQIVSYAQFYQLLTTTSVNTMGSAMVDQNENNHLTNSNSTNHDSPLNFYELIIKLAELHCIHEDNVLKRLNNAGEQSGKKLSPKFTPSNLQDFPFDNTENIINNDDGEEDEDEQLFKLYTSLYNQQVAIWREYEITASQTEQLQPPQSNNNQTNSSLSQPNSQILTNLGPNLPFTHAKPKTPPRDPNNSRPITFLDTISNPPVSADTLFPVVVYVLSQADVLFPFFFNYLIQLLPPIVIERGESGVAISLFDAGYRYLLELDKNQLKRTSDWTVETKNAYLSIKQRRKQRINQHLSLENQFSLTQSAMQQQQLNAVMTSAHTKGNGKVDYGQNGQNNVGNNISTITTTAQLTSPGISIGGDGNMTAIQAIGARNYGYPYQSHGQNNYYYKNPFEYNQLEQNNQDDETIMSTSGESNDHFSSSISQSGSVISTTTTLSSHQPQSGSTVSHNHNNARHHQHKYLKQTKAILHAGGSHNINPHNNNNPNNLQNNHGLHIHSLDPNPVNNNPKMPILNPNTAGLTSLLIGQASKQQGNVFYHGNFLENNNQNLNLQNSMLLTPSFSFIQPTPIFAPTSYNENNSNLLGKPSSMLSFDSFSLSSHQKKMNIHNGNNNNNNNGNIINNSSNINPALSNHNNHFPSQNPRPSRLSFSLSHSSHLNDNQQSHHLNRARKNSQLFLTDYTPHDSSQNTATYQIHTTTNSHNSTPVTPNQTIFGALQARTNQPLSPIVSPPQPLPSANSPQPITPIGPIISNIPLSLTSDNSPQEKTIPTAPNILQSTLLSPINSSHCGGGGGGDDDDDDDDDEDDEALLNSVLHKFEGQISSDSD